MFTQPITIGQARLFSIIWCIISCALSIFLKNIDWVILSYICMIFSGLCFWHFLRMTFPSIFL